MRIAVMSTELDSPSGDALMCTKLVSKLPAIHPGHVARITRKPIAYRSRNSTGIHVNVKDPDVQVRERWRFASTALGNTATGRCIEDCPLSLFTSTVNGDAEREWWKATTTMSGPVGVEAGGETSWSWTAQAGTSRSTSTGNKVKGARWTVCRTRRALSGYCCGRRC